MNRAWTGWGVALTVAAGSGWFLWQATLRGQADAAELRRLRQAEIQLRERLTSAEQQLQALGQPVLTPGVGSSRPNASAANSPAARHHDDELTAQLHAKDEHLRHAEATVASLRDTTKDLERRLEAAEERYQQGQTAEAALKEKVDDLGRQFAALQKAAEAKDARVAALEAAQRTLAVKAEETGRNGAKWRKLTDDLEDVARRREALVTNLATRYREASDTLRTLSLQLENRGAGAASGPNDLSRIQNAVTLAEEDLRQLRNLTTRARQLQKDLAAAK